MSYLKPSLLIVVFALVSVPLFPWKGASADALKLDGRWYTQEHVKIGQSVFKANCAACHGAQAAGLTQAWRKPGADGAYPPPPLNGTAHAWHHPLSVLLRTVRDGGVRFGGKMPGFKGQLGNAEMLAAIAYFQEFWSDDTYNEWNHRGGTKK